MLQCSVVSNITMKGRLNRCRNCRSAFLAIKIFFNAASSLVYLETYRAPEVSTPLLVDTPIRSGLPAKIVPRNPETATFKKSNVGRERSDTRDLQPSSCGFFGGGLFSSIRPFCFLQGSLILCPSG